MRMPDALPSLAMKLGFAAALMACALGSAFHRSTDPVAMQAASELPSSWDGHPLRPLALSPVEQRFAAQFPGHVTRLTDGLQVLVWRDVQRPTRMALREGDWISTGPTAFALIRYPSGSEIYMDLPEQRDDI